MPKQTYALETGGPKRLEVSWKGLYKDLTIALDGHFPAPLPTRTPS